MEFEPNSEAILTDPYRAYAWLQNNDPMQWSESSHAWVVSRYADVRAMLMDARTSARHSVQQLGGAPDVDLGVFGRVATLPSSDPPRHTRLRSLVNKAFTPASVQGIRPLAEDIVDGIVETALERGHLDVYEDLASAFPTQIIAAMLGIPATDWSLFRTWSDALFYAFKGSTATAAELAAAQAGAASLEAYFQDVLASRMPADDDLVSRIKYARQGDDHLSEGEVLATCVMLLVAGNETTTGLLVNSVAALASRPTVIAALRRDPDLIESVVEECLRLVGPVHFTVRKALEELEIQGRKVVPGEAVVLLTAAANRDPRQFDSPDQLVPDRSPNDHLAFGRGRHFCLGASLTRLEARVAIGTLLRRLPDLHAPDGDRQPWVGPLTARRRREIRLEWDQTAMKEVA